MGLARVVLSSGVLAVVAGRAAAEPALELARVAVDTPEATPATAARSRTIYLNRGGGLLMPGPNDARHQTSSLVTQPVQLAGWQASDADWAAVVACLRDMWAPFAVELTEVDPGTTRPHIEAMFVRSPVPLGMPAKLGGVAPMSRTCAVVENAIVFTFTDNIGKPRRICEVMAQEIGHAYGLDHELVPDDPMTYLSFAGPRWFQDEDAACGETEPRPCGIDGSVCRATQNSFRLLRERLVETVPDDTPPVLEVPVADGARVTSPLLLRATASDASGVAEVGLALDGRVVALHAAPPYEWELDVAPGAHALVVRALDHEGNATLVERTVIVEGAGDDEADLGAVSLGCGASRGPAGLGVVLLAGLGRRRHRQRRPVSLA